MNAYTKEYIGQLLDRFMNGMTTLEEEVVLADYFRHSAVREEWTAYKEMFAYFDGGMKQEKSTRKGLRKVWLAAASIVALGILTFMLWPRPEQPSVAEVRKTVVPPPVKQDSAKIAPAPVPAPRSLRSNPRLMSKNEQRNRPLVHKEEALQKLEAENAQLKAQLESIQQEIEQIREQVFISEMQTRGYQAVYLEDGNIQFVSRSQMPASVEL